MKKKDLYTLLNKIAPLDLAEEWDNSGIQIDLGKEEINKVLLALEIDNNVVEAAINAQADMIITHHPLIFPVGSISSICSYDVKQRNIIHLIQSGIEVYSAHTCYDAAPGCMNDYLCELLEIRRPQVFEGNIARIGRLSEPMTLAEFEKRVYERLGKPDGMICGGDPKKLIRTVAVCSGGGGEFWISAYKCGADLFISGEIKHHEMAYMKQEGMAFIAAGHAATEWIFVPRFASQISRMCLDELEIIEYDDHQIPFDRVL